MYILYTLIGGGGQMSNTFFESGGNCPHLLIIGGGGGGGGADVLIYHFHRGQMSEGANVLHSDQTWAPL